jgi:streptogrisin D
MIMWNDSGAGCTSGFGVRDAGGAKYILTAAHCGQLGSQWSDADGEPIGSMVARNQNHDVALIATALAGDTIYAGGLDDEHQLVVSGWTNALAARRTLNLGPGTSAAYRNIAAAAGLSCR